MENLNKEIKAQVRATRIFKALIKTPMTVEQIAGKVQIHKPTIDAILKKLLKLEFVRKELVKNEKGNKDANYYHPINQDKFDFRYEKINEKDCDSIPTHILEAIRDGKVKPSIIKVHRSSDVKYHAPVKLRKVEPHMKSSMDFV
jgi:predicted transcriptional regulator